MMFFRPTVLPIDPFGTPDRGFATMRVTSPYGRRDGQFSGFHPALDIGNARLGDDVIAIGSGTVIHSSIQPAPPWNYPAPPDKQVLWNSPSYGGNVTVIEHTPGVWSQYVHLADLLLRPGQRVVTAQLVGHVGDTGSAAPPPAGGGGHLHFGIRLAAALGNGHDGWVDPWPLIQPTGSLATLPDTAIQEDAMPKVIRTLVGQEAVIRAGSKVYRERPAFGAASYDITVPATVQPAYEVEGDAYRTSTGTLNRWIEFGGTDAAQRRYVPSPYVTLQPFPVATSLQVERMTDAAKAARRAITAVINIGEE